MAQEPISDGFRAEMKTKDYRRITVKPGSGRWANCITQTSHVSMRSHSTSSPSQDVLGMHGLAVINSLSPSIREKETSSLQTFRYETTPCHEQRTKAQPSWWSEMLSPSQQSRSGITWDGNFEWRVHRRCTCHIFPQCSSSKIPYCLDTRVSDTIYPSTWVNRWQ